MYMDSVRLYTYNVSAFLAMSTSLVNDSLEREIVQKSTR